MLSFFPRDVLDGIWDLIGSVSEGFPTYFCKIHNKWPRDYCEMKLTVSLKIGHKCISQLFYAFIILHDYLTMPRKKGMML